MSEKNIYISYIIYTSLNIVILISIILQKQWKVTMLAKSQRLCFNQSGYISNN